MKLEDIRLVLSSKKGVDRLTKKREKLPIIDENLCNYPGCLEKGVVPDGGILYCSKHHFKCATWSDYGEHMCKNRVEKLGDFCDSCNKENRGRRYYRSGRR